MKQLKNIGTGVFHTCIILVALIVMPTGLFAQDEADDGPAYIRIRVDTVKPDQVSDWEARIKERTDAFQAAEQPFHHVFQRLRGPAYTYLVITGEPGIGTGTNPIEMPEEWARGITATLASASTNTLRAYGELFTVQNGSVAPPTEFMHVRFRNIAQGRSGNYLQFLTNKLMPALKEANVGDVRVLRSALGGNTNSWITFSFVDGWPPKENNMLAKSMGESAMQEMLAEGASMQTSGFDYFYRYRSDLSYTAE